MGVSRSGSYDFLEHTILEPSSREQEDALLLAQFRDIFGVSGRRYGSPRIHAELRKCGVVCSLRRVKRLMRQAGLQAARFCHLDEAIQFRASPRLHCW